MSASLRGIKENHCIIIGNFLHWHQTQLHSLASLAWEKAFHCLLQALASFSTTFPCTACELEAFLSWGFSMQLLSFPVSRHCLSLQTQCSLQAGLGFPTWQGGYRTWTWSFWNKGMQMHREKTLCSEPASRLGQRMFSGLPRALLRKGRDPPPRPASWVFCLLPTASPPGRARSSVATPSCRGSRST